LRHARNNFPENPNSFLHSAELAKHQSNKEDLDFYLGKAQKQFPKLIETWLKSAEYSMHYHDYDSAELFNSEARKLANKNAAPPFIQYAEIAMLKKSWGLALVRWEMVRKKFPKHPSGYDQAAKAAKALGKNNLGKELKLAQEYGPSVLKEPSVNEKPIRHIEKSAALSGFLSLIWLKAILNLKSEVKRSFLSYGWWVLEPLLHMGIYYLVFGFLLNRGGENFSVFLLTGLIPWMWFSKSINNCSTSILEAQNTILQINLPPLIFPLISIVQNTLKQGPILLLLLGFTSLQGFCPNIYWWSLILIFLVQLNITIFFSCLIAAVIPFIRDFIYIVGSGLTFLMFLSGIFYDYRTISEDWHGLFFSNPIAFLLKCYREVLIESSSPDLLVLSYWGLAFIIANFILAFIYQQLRYSYPRIILE